MSVNVRSQSQGLMTSRSLLLLTRLAVGDALEVGWNSALKSFKLSYGICENDLEPLLKAGWVDQRPGRGGKVIWITDEGNAVVRGLVDWLKFKAEAGEVKP